MDLVKTTSSSRLSQRAMKVFYKAPELMYVLRGVHIIYFCDLVEEHELFHDESLVENPYFALLGPPHNLYRVLQHENSVYERLSTNDLVHDVKIDKAEIKPGSHSILFCSARQLGSWFKTLSRGGLRVTSPVLKMTPLETK